MAKFGRIAAVWMAGAVLALVAPARRAIAQDVGDAAAVVADGDAGDAAAASADATAVEETDIVVVDAAVVESEPASRGARTAAVRVERVEAPAVEPMADVSTFDPASTYDQLDLVATRLMRTEPDAGRMLRHELRVERRSARQALDVAVRLDRLAHEVEPARADSATRLRDQAREIRERLRAHVVAFAALWERRDQPAVPRP